MGRSAGNPRVKVERRPQHTEGFRSRIGPDGGVLAVLEGTQKVVDPFRLIAFFSSRSEAVTGFQRPGLGELRRLFGSRPGIPTVFGVAAGQVVSQLAHQRISKGDPSLVAFVEGHTGERLLGGLNR